MKAEAIAERVDVAELVQGFRGQVLQPGDAGYDEARKVWNGSIDRRPAVIARCTGAADVISAVRFARSRDLLIAVRGGGHNIAGLAVCDGGIVIDCQPMKGVRVDTQSQRALVQPGLLWGELDHETQALGLAVPGGVITTTGVAGFTLGGGFGYLSRKFGLACDSLISADVVTAEGELLRASATENSDLFWGLRGGGGNFGIVTSFEFQLHRVGPTVLAGIIAYPLEQARQILRFVDDFIQDAPDELFIIPITRQAPPAPFLPTEAHGAHMLMLATCHCGDPEEGGKLLASLRQLGEPVADVVQPRPYTQWQAMLDASWGPGLQNYWKAEYLAPLSDTAIDTLVGYAENITSPLSDIKLGFWGGAIARVAEDDTAFGHRGAHCIMNVNTRWANGSGSQRHIEWTRELWSAMQPFSSGGVYVNFLGEEGHERVRSAYGEAKYDRLVAVKRKYDPTNFFRVNQNISPGK